MNELQKLDAQGKAAIDRDDFLEARRAFEEGVRVAQSGPLADPNMLGQLLNNAGYACVGMEDYQSAEHYFERAIQVYRGMGDPDNPELAISLQHLGRRAHAQGDYGRSWLCWTEALSIWKRVVLGQRRSDYLPYLASALHACGEHFADSGKYEPARTNFEQALSLRENIFPANHPEIAENVANLGKLCAFLGDWPAARRYLTRAITLCAAELGSDHPAVRGLEDALANTEDHLK
jgi:tetratricopeptide (TPR) repeat protein